MVGRPRLPKNPVARKRQQKKNLNMQRRKYKSMHKWYEVLNTNAAISAALKYNDAFQKSCPNGKRRLGVPRCVAADKYELSWVDYKDMVAQQQLVNAERAREARKLKRKEMNEATKLALSKLKSKKPAVTVVRTRRNS